MEAHLKKHQSPDKLTFVPVETHRGPRRSSPNRPQTRTSSGSSRAQLVFKVFKGLLFKKPLKAKYSQSANWLPLQPPCSSSQLPSNRKIHRRKCRYDYRNATKLIAIKTIIYETTNTPMVKTAIQLSMPRTVNQKSLLQACTFGTLSARERPVQALLSPNEVPGALNLIRAVTRPPKPSVQDWPVRIIITTRQLFIKLRKGISPVLPAKSPL